MQTEYGVRDFQEALGDMEYYTYKLYLNGNSTYYLNELADAADAYGSIIEELTGVVSEITEIEEDIAYPPYSFDDSDYSDVVIADDTVQIF